MKGIKVCLLFHPIFKPLIEKEYFKMARANRVTLESVKDPELKCLLKKYKEAVESKAYESECGFTFDEEKAERRLHRKEAALVLFLNNRS